MSRQQTLCATSKDFGRGDQLLLPPLLLLLLLLPGFTEEYDDERKQCPPRVDRSWQHLSGSSKTARPSGFAYIFTFSGL